jgi:hypothetical protein
VRLAFPRDDPTRIFRLSAAEVEMRIERRRPILQQNQCRLPNASALQILLCIVGPGRLAPLMSRHTAPSHKGRSGTPDLFLYAIRKETGDACVHRFVEVKKPGEVVSNDQIAEINS